MHYIVLEYESYGFGASRQISKLCRESQKTPKSKNPQYPLNNINKENIMDIQKKEVTQKSLVANIMGRTSFHGQMLEMVEK